VDGIVISPGPHAAEPGRALPLLAKSAARTVLIDRIYPELPFDQVGTDNVEPVAALVEHLAATHGHRRIGFIAGLPGLATTEERLAGFGLGVRRAGADGDSDLVQIGGSSREGGGIATTMLLALDVPPTALIAGNNAMTVGMLRTLSRGRIAVPAQMAIAGFDDFEWADLLVAPLTAIAQDWERIGTRAVELLIRRLDELTAAARIIERTPTRLQVRRSCGCSGVFRTVRIPSRVAGDSPSRRVPRLP
jgi:LacI family transcriptional regulator